MGSHPTDGTNNEQTHRRAFLTATGAGLAGLAGCMSNPGNGNEGSDGDGNAPSQNDTGNNNSSENTNDTGGEPHDEIYTSNMWQNPEQIQFNPYAAKNYSGWAESLLFEEYAKFLPLDNDFQKILAEDWNFSSESLEITLTDTFTWHDGTPVTADDAVTDLTIRNGMDYPVGQYIDTVSKTGKRSFQVSLSQPVGKPVFLPLLFQLPLRTNHDLFGKYAEQFKDASTEDEKTAVQEELIQTRVEEAVGTGPWKLSDIQTKKVVYELYDDHPSADAINFPTLDVKWTTSNAQRYQMFKTDNLDGGGAFTPQEVLQGYPDHVDEFRVPAYDGSGLIFQHEKEPFDKPEARKAIAYILSRKPVGETIYAPVNTTVEVPSGIPPTLVEEWIPDAKSKLTPYETNEEKAANLLNEIGYTKEDGTWKDDNGDPFSGQIVVPANTGNQIQGWQHAAEVLKGFGLKINVRTVEGTAFHSKTLPNGDFHMARAGWGGGKPHPFFSFQQMLGETGFLNEAGNIPKEVSVPMPIGDTDGSTQTINYSEKLSALAQAEKEEAREISAEIAWAFNQTLPVLPVVEKKWQGFLTSDHWDYPGTDSAIANVGHLDVWLQRRGEVTAKTK